MIFVVVTMVTPITTSTHIEARQRDIQKEWGSFDGFCDGDVHQELKLFNQLTHY
jgi:hypothetical protein